MDNEERNQLEKQVDIMLKAFGDATDAIIQAHEKHPEAKADLELITKYVYRIRNSIHEVAEILGRSSQT